MSNFNYKEDQNFQEGGALWPFLKRLFAYSFQHKNLFFPFVIAAVIVGISDALWPLLWKYFLDAAIVPSLLEMEQAKAAGIPFQFEWDLILKYGALYILNGTIQVMAVFVFIWMSGSIQERVLFQLREEMFHKLQGLSFSYFDKSQSGWLLSRISSDADRVTALISWGFLDLMWGLTMIGACLIIMFFYEWRLATIILFSIPILMVLTIKIRTLILKYARESRRVNSEITAAYTEHINGIEVNKATGQEEKAGMFFNELADKMRASSFRASFYTAMYMPLVIAVGSLAAVLIIYFGGKMAAVGIGGISIGLLAAFFGYATRIFEPILDIAGFYASAQRSLSAGERIFSLLDEEPEINDEKSEGEFEKIQGEIEFEQVDFSYREGQQVLKDFNLKIKAGQSVALVGPTGEGKSTIVNMIARFYEPVQGRLLIDGIDYQKRKLKSLRSQLGMVLQTPHLFSGTLASNVRFSKPKASDDEIKEALLLVGADSLLARLDEEVGEGGEKLSEGERQLVSFARAILVEPRILIMDEATSSIDVVQEAAIQKGIEDMIQGRTSIIIAHRLSTIRNCDRILVIDKGSIAEDGSHEELLELKGKYHGLYTRQLREVPDIALRHAKELFLSEQD